MYLSTLPPTNPAPPSSWLIPIAPTQCQLPPDWIIGGGGGVAGAGAASALIAQDLNLLCAIEDVNRGSALCLNLIYSSSSSAAGNGGGVGTAAADWAVIIRLYERALQRCPRLAYAVRGMVYVLLRTGKKKLAMGIIRRCKLSLN